MDLHHKVGRSGFYFFWPRFFMAICRECHDSAHFRDTPEAERLGLIVRRTPQERLQDREEAREWMAVNAPKLIQYYPPRAF